MDFEKRNLKEMKPRFLEKEQSLEALQLKIEEFEDSIAAVQDRVFASLCKKTGFANIREYEALQGSLQHEAMEKQSQFDSHKQQLKKQYLHQFL